jgi:hypothetical protein
VFVTSGPDIVTLAAWLCYMHAPPLDTGNGPLLLVVSAAESRQLTLLLFCVNEELQVLHLPIELCDWNHYRDCGRGTIEGSDS